MLPCFDSPPCPSAFSAFLPPRPLHPVPATPLCHVQGGIRLRRQVTQTRASLGAGSNPERGAQGPGTALPVPGGGPQLNPDSFRNPGAQLKARLGQPHSELLATDASGYIADADLLLDGAGKVQQRGISGRM